MQIRGHASANLLAALQRGELSPGVALVTEAHLDLCEVCRRNVPRVDEPALESSAPSRAALAEIASLSNVPQGRTARVSWGITITPLIGVSGLGESVHVMDAAPATPIRLSPDAEWVLILSGAVEARREGYGAGDLIEAAAERLADAHARSAARLLVVSADELYGASFLERLVRNSR